MGLNPFDKKEYIETNPIHIEILVPSTERSKPVSKDRFNSRIRTTVSFLNQAFGGTTRYNGIGSFRYRGKNIEEPVGKVESYSKLRDYQKAKARLRRWLRGKKKSWKQISLAFIFEEDLYFI